MSTLNSSVYPVNDSNCTDGIIGCSADYSTLNGYNSTSASFVAGPPVPSQTAVQPVVIVPTYGGVGYNVLQNNLPVVQLTSSGYFSIQNAYPSYGNNCQGYVQNLASLNYPST